MQETSSTFQLDRTTMLSLGDQLASEISTASPFPYIVADDVFPAALLDDVLSEYPDARGRAVAVVRFANGDETRSCRH